ETVVCFFPKAGSEPEIGASTVMNYRMLLELAVNVARDAGALLAEDFYRPTGPRGLGDHAEADSETEKLIRVRLQEAAPDFGIRGEELPGEDRASRDSGRHLWLIDPNVSRSRRVPKIS